MDAVVRFFADHVGLPLRFSSPEWSEFDTGSTTLALHVASPEKPAGTCEIGSALPTSTPLREVHGGRGRCDIAAGRPSRPSDRRAARYGRRGVQRKPLNELPPVRRPAAQAVREVLGDMGDKLAELLDPFVGKS